MPRFGMLHVLSAEKNRWYIEEWNKERPYFTRDLQSRPRWYDDLFALTGDTAFKRRDASFAHHHRSLPHYGEPGRSIIMTNTPTPEGQPSPDLADFFQFRARLLCSPEQGVGSMLSEAKIAEIYLLEAELAGRPINYIA